MNVWVIVKLGVLYYSYNFKIAYYSIHITIFPLYSCAEHAIFSVSLNIIIEKEKIFRKKYLGK